ncbi:thermonuclease family protein [Sphingomonas sp. RB56-2]|uniref:Thermonuclease family protein n=1 Tax=Sphingomonas brevis TaxID=2908206 RepID=A0ABT0SAM4_9SPHN|nr:thermonuclease family protein [Sphingomonas brevis]MCL6741194.1 thermonuclease family protein [Sphingomonas brevis]
MSSYWPEAKRPRAGWYRGLWGLAAIAALVGVASVMADSNASSYATEKQALLDSRGVRESFGYCHTGGGTNCVVDGDTIWFHGQNIRIVGLDTPETHDFGCADEKSLGDRATRRLHQLVNGGVVSLSTIDRDEDRYGRKLRIVKVDGVSVADTLIADGLAYRYNGGPKQSWC